MAGNIKGITIEFDGKTTALSAALKKVKAETRGVQADLNAVNRQLRFDPKNAELLAQKQTLLKQKIEGTKTELQKFRDIQKQLETNKVSKTSAEYMRVKREIEAAKGQLRHFNAELAKTTWAGVKTLGTDIQSAGQKLTRATRYARMFAGALAGIALYKGFQRLKSLDETSKQLEVLGYRGKQLDGIMEDVSSSVNGTRFMLQDMAKVATGALGSGVTEKYGLNEYLSRTADLAQLTGLSVTDMGAMLNKAYSKGKVQAQLLNQFNQRGIPIYKLLQQELGVTAEELAEMSKAGKITFDDLYNATNRYQGLAQKMGTETLPGALTVLQQQFGLIGADFLSGVYEPMKTGIQGLVTAIKNLRADGTFKQWGEDLGNTVKYFVEYFTKGETSMAGMSERAQALTTALAPLVKTIGGIVQLIAGLPPQLQGVLAFMTLFGGPLLTGIGTAVTGFASLATNIQTFILNAQAGVLPVQTLTAGTTGLGSAVSLLINPFTLAIAAVAAWALGIKKANDALHSSTTAFQEWSAGAQVGIDAAKSSGAEVDVYKQKLMELMGKEKKSASDKALIKTYVDKLNGAIDGLNLKYNEEKDALNKTTKALQKKIDKYKESAMVKAYEDMITEAAKKEAEEQIHLQDLYKERKQLQDKWNQSADHSALLETQYKQSLAETNAKIKDSKAAIKGYKGEMDKAANAIKGLSEDSKKGYSASSKAAKTAASQTAGSAKKMAEHAEREFRRTTSSAKSEGNNTARGYTQSIAQGAGPAKGSAQKMANSAKAGLKVNTTGLGGDFGSGFARGIQGKIQAVAAAAASLVKKAIAAAKNAQDSGSPSKVMRRVGRDYGAGYMLGINDELFAVQGAAHNLVSGAIGAAMTPAGSIAGAGGSQMIINASVNITGEEGAATADEFIQELELRARELNEG